MKQRGRDVQLATFNLDRGDHYRKLVSMAGAEGEPMVVIVRRMIDERHERMNRLARPKRGRVTPPEQGRLPNI